MNDLQELFGALFSPDPPEKGESPDLSGFMQLAGSLFSAPPEEKEPPPSSLPDIGQLMSVLSAFGQDDKNILLLKALKPHLSEKRAARADDVIRLMRLVNLLPLLGLFPSAADEGKEQTDGSLEP